MNGEVEGMRKCVGDQCYIIQCPVCDPLRGVGYAIGIRLKEEDTVKGMLIKCPGEEKKEE